MADTLAEREEKRLALRAWRAANRNRVKAHNGDAYARNKEAMKAYAREYRQRNKDALKAKHAEYVANMSPEKKAELKRNKKSGTFKRKYGITLEQYEAMPEQQGGLCALCKTPRNERYGVLNVDHCHSTGRVRGLLCTPCNHALGVLGDNPEGLSRALNYVKGKL